MTGPEHAARLGDAVNRMAGRYGISCMDQMAARTRDEIRKADRAASRQYRALMRLTSALANLAGGTYQ